MKIVHILQTTEKKQTVHQDTPTPQTKGLAQKSFNIYNRWGASKHAS